jgi:hypothetical protein
MSSRVTPAADPTSFLRKTLLGDAAASGLSGLILVAAPGAIASLIGVRSAVVVAVVGIALIAYGAGLLRSARRERVRREDALTPIALNLAWLVGTAVIVAGGWLSRPGNWALLLVADVVLLFAILEGVGLRRMARSGAATQPA